MSGKFKGFEYLSPDETAIPNTIIANGGLLKDGEFRDICMEVMVVYKPFIEQVNQILKKYEDLIKKRESKNKLEGK